MKSQLFVLDAKSDALLRAAVQIHFFEGIVRTDMQAFGAIGDLSKPTS